MARYVNQCMAPLSQLEWDLIGAEEVGARVHTKLTAEALEQIGPALLAGWVLGFWAALQAIIDDVGGEACKAGTDSIGNIQRVELQVEL